MMSKNNSSGTPRERSAATDSNREKTVTLDIVIPVYNEESVIPHLFDALEDVFNEAVLQDSGIAEAHYIFVDDGGTDRGAEMICERIQNGAPATLIRLSRNFGHQAAVCAGLAESHGDVTVVMDADMQDPPSLIPDMLRMWRSGVDVVYGQRRNRKENPLKVFAYWAFYRLLRLMTELKVPLDSGDFCLMDSSVVSAINEMPEVLRFPRGLRSWVGFRQEAMPYDRPERAFGTTKYSLKKLYALATDGIASLSLRPLKFSQLSSFVMAIVSLATLAMIVWTSFFRSESRMDVRLMLVLLCVLITSSVQMFSIYILGAYVGRTYLEVKHRPTFVVRQKITKR